MIVDASVVIDALVDAGGRGDAARDALARAAPTEVLAAPGHFAIELLSALNAVARRPRHPFTAAQISAAIDEAAQYGITVEVTPWSDIGRAYELSQGSLRFEDAIYVATAERHGADLLTSDARIARSGAQIRCRIVTVG